MRLTPRIVVIVCLPLPAVAVLGGVGLLIERINEPFSMLFKLPFVLGYVLLILPAMYVIEPFAIIATIWYSARATGDSIRSVVTCWIAVAVHTIVLIWFLANNAPRR